MKCLLKRDVKTELPFAIYISESLGATIKLTKSLSAMAPGIFRAVCYGAYGYSQAATKKNSPLIVHKL
jgi:hypothetical protein